MFEVDLFENKFVITDCVIARSYKATWQSLTELRIYYEIEFNARTRLPHPVRKDKISRTSQNSTTLT
jgi:hypothetical protein